jgi:Cdc6-like AAA superfamily ATPase
VQEAGDEEKKEVSVALRNLRKKYDEVHKMTAQKEEELELIKKGVKKIREEEKLVKMDTGGAETETLNAKMELEQVKETHAFEELHQAQYQHMLKRMKKDLVAL